ncbi:phosphonate C-P lyase system protein PhnH [Hwanghaeella grinnelliae]|uniref:Phosphonate C-P lyase system protein PhnH n=1 Tax=Hwanghaeella grinnelliae TaxID=2500179 RepID=A0A437QKX7_9PROT|nr:phosphonate C-P lyase system protein PhnH [Hwanghaeella grinnelliae]RVU35156.1 phosphonate C-P lyase system protein PhnH [Hwanghaeella grinnelliae]
MESALQSRAIQEASALCRPFEDPVGDASRMFRAFLTAMSHPGRVVAAFGPGDYPEPLGTTGFGAALTLLDADTPVYLSPQIGTARTLANLRFHCGCPIVDEPAAASFAFMTMAEAETVLPKLSVGTPDYPDRSATALILGGGFTNNDTVRLTGPGIYKYKTLGMNAPQGFWTHLQCNADRYPLGFDTVFIAEGEIVGLPRSTRIDPTITAEEC